MLLIKKIFVVFTVILFSVIYCSKLEAQDRKFAVKGTTELAGSISYSSFTSVSNGSTGDAISIFSFAPQVGYFVIDGLELGLSTGALLLPGFSSVSPEEGDNTTVVQFFASPSYNFQTKSNIYPFLEAQIGYSSLSSGGSETLSGFSYGARGGMKIAPVEHFLLTFSVQYLLLTFNPEGADERSGFNYLSVGIGVGGYF
jgi:hypothetical protein